MATFHGKQAFYLPCAIPRLPEWLARGHRSPCRAPPGLRRRHPSGWFVVGSASPRAPPSPAAPELCLPCRRWPWRYPLKGHEHATANTPLRENQRNKRHKGTVQFRSVMIIFQWTADTGVLQVRSISDSQGLILRFGKCKPFRLATVGANPKPTIPSQSENIWQADASVSNNRMWLR